MLFSSIPFLYYFLFFTLLLYAIMPRKGKNFVLLASSLFFYYWGEPKYVILMGVSILLGYLHGLLIHHFAGKTLSRVFLVSSVATSLLLLGYFKYADFFITSFNSVFGQEIPLLKIALPIGISFYTFQMLSYTVDVYRGDTPVQKNLLDLATYISLFPQLIAGPIVRYADVQKEITHRTHSLQLIAEGVMRFSVGLAKKILIANQMGLFCQTFRDSTEKTVLFYWLYAIAYTFQIYFDFSGYSDMAIGLGKIFGFHFLENFNYPFVSKSITEFWRRWHMSLGSWFRDYVYIPMGGNRCSKGRWFLNIMTVWALTGLWHGANWTFVLWGLSFGVLLMAEKLWLLKPLEKLPKIVSHLYVMVIVLFSFVLFNAVDLKGAVSDFSAMLGLSSLPFTGAETAYYLKNYLLLFVVAAIGSAPVVPALKKKLLASGKGQTAVAVMEPIFTAAFLLTATAFLVDGSFNPFLYFRF